MEKSLTAPEMALVKKVQGRISDLKLSQEYMQPKNLVRFIRARNGNLNQIENMIRKNVEFYATHDITAMLKWPTPNSFETFFPYSIIGFDDLGGPILYIPFGKWDPTAVPSRKEEFFMFSMQSFEIVWGLMRRNSQGKSSIPRFSVIADLEGLGWRHVTTYDFVQACLTNCRIFEENFPDTLRSVVFVNTPQIFGMLWKLASSIMSAETLAKVAILGTDKTEWIQEIGKFARPEQIPEKYGGLLPDNAKGIRTRGSEFSSYAFPNGNDCDDLEL